MRNEQPAVAPVEARSALGKAAELVERRVQMAQEYRSTALLIVLVVRKRFLHIEVGGQKRDQLTHAALAAPPRRRTFTASQVVI